ncbi:MAG: PRC-barrel domain-containing protein, partial [Rhodobacteraceae bacterium]|nr:PRC-barrel domain-containing protein [Paracoccaceae bacterium]
MKKLFLSTTLCGLIALSAAAQTASHGTFRTTADPTEIRASDFIGKRVYASETELGAKEYSAAAPDWSDIGEINDVVMT